MKTMKTPYKEATDASKGRSNCECGQRRKKERTKRGGRPVVKETRGTRNESRKRKRKQNKEGWCTCLMSEGGPKKPKASWQFSAFPALSWIFFWLCRFVSNCSSFLLVGQMFQVVLEHLGKEVKESPLFSKLSWWDTDVACWTSLFLFLLLANITMSRDCCQLCLSTYQFSIITEL